MVATWPSRGQEAPDFWDGQLKDYIDSFTPLVDGEGREVIRDRRLSFLANGVDTTGVGNSTSAIQDVIDEAQETLGALTGYGTSFMAMAEVIIPPGEVVEASGLVLNGRVHLRSAGSRLRARTSGPIITLRGNSAGVSDLMLDGGGVARDASAILCDADGVGYTRALHYMLDRLRFQDFAGRAVLADDGSIGNMDNLFAQNCLLDTGALSDFAGVVEMRGNDSVITNSELTAGRLTMSAGGFACAMAILGANAGNNTVGDGTVLEISDHGLYINTPTVAATKLGLARADLNRGHGVIIAGGVGIVDGFHSYRNGQETANTYNAFQVSGGQFIFGGGTLAEGLSSLHLIGFNDTQNSDASKNWYSSARSIAHSLKGFSNASAGARIDLPTGPEYLTIGTSTTWNVDQLTDIKAVNTVAKTLVAWTNGFYGQRIRVRGDGFTTIPHNPGGSTSLGQAFSNKMKADLLLEQGVIYEYARIDTGIWTQIGGDVESSRRLVSGETTLAREFVTYLDRATGSGNMRLTYFTAQKNEIITQVKMFTGSTAAGATPTLVRIGIWTADASGALLALVGSTPNDTTLLADANTGYTKALSASWAKVAGQRYAHGILVVTAATAPTMAGLGIGGLPTTELAIAPRIAGYMGALSDLPSSAGSGSISNASSLYYAALLP